MSIFKCPGSEEIRSPHPEIVPCPWCGAEVELWSDEAETDCPRCGKPVYREIPPSCWEWCACARECLGPEKYDRLKKARETGEARETREKPAG